MKYLCELAMLLILAVEGHFTKELCSNPTDHNHEPEFLSPHEIRLFMNKTLEATLTEKAITLVSDEELGIPAQQQYVNSSMIFERIKMAIHDHLSNEFIEYSPDALYCTLYEHFFTNVVNKALTKRNEVLLEKQKIRENKLVEGYLSKIEKNIKTGLKEDLDSTSTLDSAIEIIIQSSNVQDIQNVFSYPVVRDEIHSSYKKNYGDWNAAVLSSIVPFLHEAIQRAETRNTSQDINERMANELSSAFLPPITQSVQDGIQKARHFYHFINQNILQRIEARADFYDTITAHIYRSISYLLYQKPRIFHDTIIGDNKTYLGTRAIKKMIARVAGKKVGRLATDYLLQRINSIISVYDSDMLAVHIRSNIRHFAKAQETLLMNTHEHLLEKYEAYIRLQQYFSDSHRSTLTNIAREILRTNYTDLGSTNFEIISDIVKLNIYEHDIAYNKKLGYRELHDFNNELEKHVTSLYGFTLGSFTYSKSYLDVMQSVFPSIRNPFADHKQISETKDEL